MTDNFYYTKKSTLISVILKASNFYYTKKSCVIIMYISESISFSVTNRNKYVKYYVTV